MYKYGRISPKLSDRHQFCLIIYSIHNVFWHEIPKKNVWMYRSITFKAKERPCCIALAAAVPDIQEWSSVTYKMSVTDSLSSLNYPPSPQAAVIHLNSAQRHDKVKIFKHPPCWSVCDLCVLLFFRAIQQEVTAPPLAHDFPFVSDSSAVLKRTRALEIFLFCAPLCRLWQSQSSSPSTTSPPLRLQSRRLPSLALYRRVCVCVCVCVAFPKGSAHAVSGPARCCGVTVDLFSSWLHLLEVCPAHKSQGLILLSHSKKKKRKKKKKKKEGCDYDASAELWQLSERPRLHFVILSPFSEGSKTVVFFFSVQRDEHRTFTFKCVFWQEIISAALN